MLMLGIEELLAQSVGNCLQDYLHDGAPTHLIKTSCAVWVLRPEMADLWQKN